MAEKPKNLIGQEKFAQSQKPAFSNTPPIIAMTIIAVTLIIMAQFQSTEQLAAVFAWLIFVAVVMANGLQALDTLNGIVSVGQSSTQSIDELKGQA